MRKSIQKQQEYEKAKVKLDSLEAEIKKYKEEEDKIISNAEKKIKKICEKDNLFCGIIVNKDILLQLIDMALDTKENILVPFKIYFKS